MIVAGLQVPLIPLVEANGNDGAALFWQSGPTCVNAGVILGLTVTVNVVVLAHCPADGVNV